jgi:hypothetical protein
LGSTNHAQPLSKAFKVLPGPKSPWHTGIGRTEQGQEERALGRESRTWNRRKVPNSCSGIVLARKEASKCSGANAEKETNFRNEGLNQPLKNQEIFGNVRVTVVGSEKWEHIVLPEFLLL